MALQQYSKALISIVLLLSGAVLPYTNFDLFFIQDAFAQNLEIPDTEQFRHPKIESNILQITQQLTITNNAFSAASEHDKIRVVIDLDALSSANIDELEKYGAEIEVTHDARVQALVPFYEVMNIADLEFVRYVAQPIELMPTVVSEGAGVIGADLVNNAGNTGQGVKVAVIDTGFDINNPEIAGNIVESLSFRPDGDITGGGNTDHGTAVSEIIVDVAPDVQLFVYNIQFEMELLNAIDFIVNNRDVDIISMSSSTPVGPQDGTSAIAQAVNNARNHGILFIVSAGNEAESHWEGQFSDPDGDNFNNFDRNDFTINLLAQSGELVVVVLNWDDWPISRQDFDLLIFNNQDELVAFSRNEQCEDPDDCEGAPPLELASFTAPRSGIYHIVISKFFATATPTFDLYSIFHELREHNVPSSSLSIPGDASGAFTVGATFWPNDRLEDFSSRGPTNDGRTKPDLSAPDGVTTTTIDPFFGTSPSTPYVAGAAALVKSAIPESSADTIQSLLEQNTASHHVKNNDDGTGRVDLLFLLSPPPPVDTDGDGITDDLDQCPLEPETVNGLLDDDGCPDELPIPDTDGDGISDDVDQCIAEPETFNGFQDADGCPDTLQLGNVSVETATGTGNATFSTDNGNFTSLISIDPTSLPPAPVAFPHGLFNFTITVENPGDSVNVTITFPSSIPAGSEYWKFQNGAYFQLPDELMGSNDGDSVLTLTLTDGGVGDADGLANGVIADPGGPVISGGGGIGSIGTGGGSDGGVFRGRTFAFGDPTRSDYDSKPPIIGEVITQQGSLKVLAKILDEIGVKDAKIIISKKTILMQRQSGTNNWWTGTIPSDLLSGETIFFKIVARDYNNNVGEYSGSTEVPFGVLASNEGASFIIKPLSTVSQQLDRTYSILASGVKPSSQNFNPQITIKNTSTEPLQNIRLILSPELKGKFLLSDYAIKSIAPQSETKVSLTLIGRPNVDVMNNSIPYKGQIIISINNGSPYILELSGEVPNQSSSLQSIFMKMIASKAKDRYKSFEKPELRISQDNDYEVTLGSGEHTIKSTSDELIIRNTGSEPLKNLRIMTSAASDHFLADQKSIAVVPAGSFVKVKLVSMINEAELSRDLSGELIIVPENAVPITIPINVGKKLVEDKNAMYEVNTLSGNGVISNTADGIIIRNNSNEAIENVRLILPRELSRVFSVTEDSFRSIEPNSEKIIYLEQRGTLDSNAKQILNDYKGEVIVVSSNGMKKIVPVNIVWKSISSEHFVVYARDNGDELTKATQMINFLERGHPEAAKIIGESESKTIIYMTSSFDELNMLNGAHAPFTFASNEDMGFVWSNSDDLNMLALREFAYRTIDDYATYWAKQKISLDKGNWLVDGISNYVTAKIVGERGMIKDHLDAFVAEPTSFEWYGTATPAHSGSSYTLFKFLAERYGDAVIEKTLNYLGSTMISNHRCDTFEQCALLMAIYDANGFNMNDKRHDLSFDMVVQEWKDYVLEKYGISEDQLSIIQVF